MKRKCRSRDRLRLGASISAIVVAATVAAEITMSMLPARINNNDVEALANRLAALSPTVDRTEAERVAHCAYATAATVKQQYRMIWPPLFNNILIHAGIKKRGFCFQWAEDLLGPLNELKLRTLALRWGQSRRGTGRESNCIVVTAVDQPFASGIILDGWRHCGNLYWAVAGTDEEPWVENSAYARSVNTRLTQKRSEFEQKQINGVWAYTERFVDCMPSEIRTSLNAFLPPDEQCPCSSGSRSLR